MSIESFGSTFDRLLHIFSCGSIFDRPDHTFNYLSAEQVINSSHSKLSSPMNLVSDVLARPYIRYYVKKNTTKHTEAISFIGDKYVNITQHP